jgi:hypothetical protein
LHSFRRVRWLCAHMAKLAWILSFTLMRAQALGFARTPDFSGQCYLLLPIGMRDRLRELSVFETDTAFYCHGCSTELRLRIFARTSSKWARCYLLPSRVRFQIEPFEGACTGLGCALHGPGCHRALHPCKPNTLYFIGLLGCSVETETGRFDPMPTRFCVGGG